MNVLIFLIQNVFYFFATLFLLRFFMQAFRVSFIHPLGQFILKLTNFLVVPLRKIIPSFLNLDWASFVSAFLFIFSFFILKSILQNTVVLNWGAFIFILILWSVFLFLRLIIYIFITSILMFVCFSWLAPTHPMMPLLFQFTRPVLKPIQKLIPLIAGIDLAPVVAILILEALLLLIPA